VHAERDELMAAKEDLTVTVMAGQALVEDRAGHDKVCGTT